MPLLSGVSVKLGGAFDGREREDAGLLCAASLDETFSSFGAGVRVRRGISSRLRRVFSSIWGGNCLGCAAAFLGPARIRANSVSSFSSRQASNSSEFEAKRGGGESKSSFCRRLDDEVQYKCVSRAAMPH